MNSEELTAWLRGFSIMNEWRRPSEEEWQKMLVEINKTYENTYSDFKSDEPEQLFFEFGDIQL